MKAIVYTSNSGFTRHYAELLSKETGLPVVALEESGGLAAGSQVIYMGWLMAGSIKGYKKASKRFAVKAVCAVGMAQPTEKYKEEIKSKYSTADTRVFYLQGGFNMEKLHGIYKLMMKTMAKAVGKKLEAKPDKTAEEKEMLDMMKNGGDKVSVTNLADIIAWYRAEA